MITVTQHQQKVNQLFAYAPQSEMKKIDRYKGDPRHVDIIKMIQAGQWEDFLEIYAARDPITNELKIKDAHYLLLAAFKYCEMPRLTTDELVTAFHFLYAAMDDRNYKLIAHPEKDLPKGIPQHLGYSILVHQSALPQDATNLLNALSKKAITRKGVTQNADGDFIYASFPIVKNSLERDNDTVMMPVLGFASRRDYWNDVKQGKTHIALLTPEMYAEKYIHGAGGKREGGSFVPVHDEGHFNIRVVNEIPKKTEKLIDLLLDKLDTLKSPGPVIEAGYQMPMLAKPANIASLQTLLLDQLIGMLIDGEGTHTNAFFLRNFYTELAPNDVLNALGKDVDYILEQHQKQASQTKDAGSSEIAQFSPKDLAQAKKGVLALIKPEVKILCNGGPASSKCTIS